MNVIREGRNAEFEEPKTGTRLILKTTHAARVWQAHTKDGAFIALDGDLVRLLRYLKERAATQAALNAINDEGLEDPSCTFCWVNKATDTIETRDGESETGICAACLAE